MKWIRLGLEGFSRIRGKAGFTMVELVMVVVIMGVLGLFTMNFMEQTADIYTLSTEQDALYSEVWVSLERITRELQAATQGGVTVPASGSSGNVLTFTKETTTPNDASTSLTYQVSSGRLQRVGDVSGTHTIADGITTFTVTNTSNLITILITKTKGTLTYSLQTQVYPSQERFGTTEGHWEEVNS